MYKTIFKLNSIIFLTLVGGIFAFEDLDNLDNLGERISASVRQRLAPLQNLGARISAKVHDELEPLRSGKLYNGIQQNGNQQLHDLDNLEDRISANMNSGMAQLDNLGQQIEESVYQGLEPVRAIEIVFNMKGGIGGTTIATHLPQGKKFIIRNNQIYLCSRSISDEDGSCNGTLTTFQVNNKKDYCYYKNSYSIVNNYICIGGNSILVTNNNIICNSNTETPALLITINEFNKLCDEISKTVEYKYIANPSDPAHVEIPNKNKHVKCRNNQPGVCIFSESQSISQFQQNKIQSDNYSTVFI